MEKEYQEFINLPYFKIHKPPTYELWLLLYKNKPQHFILARSPYADFVGDLIKKDKNYNEFLYNNLHLWNYTKPFVNFETTPENAKNILDFNKDVIKSAIIAGTSLEGIGTLRNLYQIAKINPHGMKNLATNLAIQTGVGTTGSVIGSELEKHYLGTNGITGSMIIGLGSIYGLNKIPFMKDFNKAISTVYRKPNPSGGLYFVDRNELIPTYSRFNKNQVKMRITDSPSESAAIYDWLDRPAIEIHLGGKTAPRKNDLLWTYNLLKSLPSGTYITPDALADNRMLRILTQGIFNYKPKFNKLVNPPSYDGYSTALMLGRKPGYELKWADNVTLTDFHTEIEFTKNMDLKNAHLAFVKNPTKENLNKLNQVLINKGGKPAFIKNSELHFPFPIVYKK